MKLSVTIDRYNPLCILSANPPRGPDRIEGYVLSQGRGRAAAIRIYFKEWLKSNYRSQFYRLVIRILPAFYFFCCMALLPDERHGRIWNLMKPD